MKKMATMLFLMIFVFPVQLLCQEHIDYGETRTGSISVDGEVDIYTFGGNSNDKIIIRMTENSGSWPLEPKIELFDPSGNPIALVSDGSQVTIKTILTVSGTFVLFASDNGGDDTGNYAVFLQRAFSPANDSLIQYGSTTTGNISTDGDVDTYSFSGSAGDRVIARLTENSNSWPLEPRIELFGPSGDSLFVDSDGAQSEIAITLPFDGSYTIFVSDSYPGDDDGSYALFLQNVSSPLNDSLIYYGQTVTGSIYTDGDIDTYTFLGSIGDSVVLRMTENSNSWPLEPMIEVFGPSGDSLVAVAQGSQAEIGVRLHETGRYTILASDSYPGDDTGDYGLFLFAFPTGIHDNSQGVPSGFGLTQNYPNPFNPSTQIRYELPTTTEVSLKVYDVTGREVATLVQEGKRAGRYEVTFDAKGLSSGTYFYTMKARSFVQTKKLMLLH